MKRWLHVVLLLSLVAVSPDSLARTLVLIASAEAPEQSLDALAMRKLFLGLPVSTAGVTLHPLLNDSEPTIDDAFLQYIVSMSQSAYDRHILTLLNTRGQPRPPQFISLPILLAHLEADPHAVSYCWQEEIESNPKIKVLRVLWHE
ncbi:MAG: hypothetical protein JOY91_02870 [Sinobacteraceae bacterium]|nr:hypothetical protein [Nevskiaceae bacterium]